MITKLISLRWEKGLSTRELAKKSGVSAMTVVRAEHRQPATQRTQFLLSKFFGVSLEELFGDNNIALEI